MASEVKADKLSPSTGTALQIGDASDTITIPASATFTITDGLPVASGGTGLTSFTAGDVLYATGTTTLAKLAKGTAEQVLAMNSGATAPDWGSVDLTVLPTITAVKGGTGQTSFTAGDIFYANSTTTITKLNKGTGLQGLQTNSGATAPEWANSPQSLMTAAGDILYASGANTLAKLAKGSNDEVLTLAAGVPSWATAGGGAWTYLDTQTGTDVSALSFDGDFTSDYDVYKYFGAVTAVTANTDTFLRYRIADTDVTASNYRNIALGGANAAGSTSTTYNGRWDDPYMIISSGDNNANIKYPVNIELTLYNPLSTDRYKLCNFQSSGWNSNTDPDLIRTFTGSGYYHADDTTALSGVTFWYDGGNITGTIREYGIKLA